MTENNIIPAVIPIRGKITKLEAIRGLAAVYVVVHHTFSDGLRIKGFNLTPLISFGQEAVILFFLLSGFVIQYAYLRSKDKSFKTYFFKRFLRIYIPLLCVFVANYFIAAAYTKPMDWFTLAGNLLMLQDISFLKPNVICDPFLGNGPLWSLSYEWWFYMLFFLITTKIKTNASTFVYLISIVSALSYIWFPNFVNRELMYLAIWWVGADLAEMYSKGTVIELSRLKLQLGALLSIIVLLTINVKINNINSTVGVSPFLELRHFAFAFIAVLMALAWSKLKWIFFDSTIGRFEAIASISFGIYISHWFLIARATYLNDYIANVFVRYSIYIIIACLFAFLVERIIYVYLNRVIIKCIKNR